MAAKPAKPAGASKGRPFKPGQSGNPGGRPKGLAKRVRERVTEDELIDFNLAVWRKNATALKKWKITPGEVRLADQQRSHEWLTERGHGKPAAYTPIEGEDPLGLEDVDAAIAAVVDELAPRRKAQTPRPPAAGTLADNREG